MSISDISQRLELALVLLVLWTLTAIPVLKFQARDIPVLRLGLIALVTFACVLAVIGGLSATSVLSLHTPLASPPILVVLVGFLIGGWMMSRWLKREGIETPFPGIGARVMMTAFLVTVAAYGVVLWYYAAPTHQL
jgi:hypothetical protein